MRPCGLVVSVELVCYFNPRTHTGCDTTIVLIATPYSIFQSTHPHGVRRIWQGLHLRQGNFNPRTHTGCDLTTKKSRTASRSYFNPRTHTGCDIVFLPFHRSGLPYFNPRTHTGCDALIFTILNISTQISIHAPTRGATLALYLSFYLICYFNPRTHTGCDVSSHQAYFCCTEYFNPRTHTGCDLWKGAYYEQGLLDFNPRTHTGCDSIKSMGCRLSQVFQSTHPHGVRLAIALRYIFVGRISIHAPTRGATEVLK